MLLASRLYMIHTSLTATEPKENKTQFATLMLLRTLRIMIIVSTCCQSERSTWMKKALTPSIGRVRSFFHPSKLRNNATHPASQFENRSREREK